MTAEPEVLLYGTEVILLVDDDEMIRVFGKTVLERFGYAVYVASDGFEGLEILKRERGRIQLVVLDLLLPGMSGRDVYDRIREMQADIPIVLTSGLDYNDAKESFGDLSRERYIVKPFSIYHLSQAVRHVLDNPYEP